MSLATSTFAGIVELGVSASYKKSNIDNDNFTLENSTSLTVSYYYGEMSAIEYSYTEGVRRNSYKPTGGETQITTNYSTLHGLDLVFSFAGRSSAFQPFIKAGAAILSKKNFYKTESLSEQETPGFSGTVPSVGLGFRVKVTSATSIKAGIDAWSVDEDKDISQWDNAARIGVTWLF